MVILPLTKKQVDELQNLLRVAAVHCEGDLIETCRKLHAKLLAAAAAATE